MLEAVGGAHLARSLEAAAVGGQVALIGVLDGYEFSGQPSEEISTVDVFWCA